MKTAPGTRKVTVRETAEIAGIGAWLILKSLLLAARWALLTHRRPKARHSTKDNPAKDRQIEALRRRVQQLEDEAAFFRGRLRHNSLRKSVRRQARLL